MLNAANGAAASKESTKAPSSSLPSLPPLTQRTRNRYGDATTSVVKVAAPLRTTPAPALQKSMPIGQASSRSIASQQASSQQVNSQQASSRSIATQKSTPVEHSRSIAQSSGPAPAIKDIPAVLFLDVDGVLHPPNPKVDRLFFRKSCMELLRDVLLESGAKIVLSTTWRLHEEGRSALAAKLSEYGIPLFVSRTPSIAQFQRPKEILAWVAKNRPRTWVAVDDWPLHEDSRMDGHFVQTRQRHGLEPATAARICALFAQQSAVEPDAA